jgi:hypothetical protein
MATKPSNANPVLTMKAMDTSDTALQSAGVSVAQTTDRREALQALLAFSTLHDQIRRRRAEEARRYANCRQQLGV